MRTSQHFNTLLINTVMCGDIYIITSDMQGLVWGEPELAHVENIE